MGIINLAPKILDPIPGGKYVVNAIDYVVNWARANSIWPLTYGTSCCAIEMMSSSMARYDIARFGSEVFRSSPRQADLFILAGTITRRMAPAIQMLWEQIPGPKYVIAMGACTISGGPFIYDNYSVVRGAQNLIPVDVFVPGCPPRPEALFHGLLTLREKILKETCRNPWHEGEPKDVSTMDRYREAAKTWAALEETSFGSPSCQGLRHVSCRILSRSVKSPWNKASGRGGQPGTNTSTGIKFCAPRTTE